MRWNGRVIQRIESRHTSKGVRLVLWGKAGRGTPYVLGALMSDDGTPADLLTKAVAEGLITETAKSP